MQSNKIRGSNEGKPLVSVLVPVYNRAEHIEPCVNSVLQQTIDNIEIIIVDNRSTDDTWEKCIKLAEGDNRIRIFQNEMNVGPVRNWEICARMAQGEYTKILFSDDLLYPDFLEKTVPVLDSHDDVGFIFTSAAIGSAIDAISEVQYTWDSKDSIVDSSEYISAVIGRREVPNSPCAALFRTSDFIKNLVMDVPTMDRDELLRFGAGPDLLLYMLTANQYPKVAHIGSTHVFFLNHEGTITASIIGKVKILYWQAILWFLQEHESQDTFNNAVILAWIDICVINRRLVSNRTFIKTVGIERIKINYTIMNVVFVKRTFNVVAKKVLQRIKRIPQKVIQFQRRSGQN